MTPEFLTILEWIAFGMGALTVYCYGHSKKQGAVLGVATAAVFMIWGASGDLWGAFTINIGFFILHSRNMKRAFNDDHL